MRVLGLSSATKKISLGFIDEGKVLFDKTIDELHSEKILYYVKQKGIKPEQIDAVAVAAGPGSYSGLRGGLATAKLLAQTLNIPLALASTLEAIAYSQIDKEGEIVVILNAKRDEYNYARFKAENGKLARLTEDLVGTLDQIDIKIDIKDAFVLKEKDPLGKDVAKLGLTRLKLGAIEDPFKAVPKYSHQPNIRKFEPCSK